MDLISITLIAIGLSMDSFAVSISNGLTISNLNVKRILTISFCLALFQAVMPLLGWLAGTGMEKYIRQYDHWIAFILLSFIGIRMIYEALKKKESQAEQELKGLTLLGQSIATSIDALVIGISFAVLDISIISPILIIGLVTFIASLLGLHLGKKLGEKTGKQVEILGGILLVGIGFKILIEHLCFH